MLAALGFATIAVFLIAIMTKRVSVLVALVLIPVVFGLLAGAGWTWSVSPVGGRVELT